MNHRSFSRHLRPRRGKRPAPTVVCLEQLEDRNLLSFSFKPLAFLGDTVPGGPIPDAGTAQFTFDFEPGDINSKGQVVFGADLTTGGEGVFFADAQGKLSAMARTGERAPGGGTFGPVFLGAVNLNDDGVAAIAFHRQHLTFPSLLEFDSGLYRYNSAKKQLKAEVLPGARAPGGGVFHGIGFQPNINNQGSIVFGAIIDTDIGPANPPGNETGLGLGVFTVDANHRVSKVARPGDPAPGGKTFDYVHVGWLNDLGDIAFTAHVQEDECIQFTASFPEGNQIFCAESIYLRNQQTGRITPIARQGDRAPGGGEFTYAFGQKINNSGQIAFIGGLAADPAGTGHLPPDVNSGVFLRSGNRNIAIARPGDPMPGGGRLVTGGFFTADVGLNNHGVVSFDAVIDTDRDGDGREDTALYTWTRGALSRVVGTGDVIPGVGLVRALKVPDLLDLPFPFSGAPINDQGQIVFQATVQDAAGNLNAAIFVATPDNDNNDDDRGDGLRAAALPATMTAETLTREQVQPLLLEAGKRWHAAGQGIAALGSIDVRISDLPEGHLGLASHGTIWLDANAAGWGWFLDPTPWEDSEFLLSGDQGEQGRMDLLTVLAHELGHLFGYEHSEGDDVMAETLTPGSRHMPAAGSAVDELAVMEWFSRTPKQR